MKWIIALFALCLCALPACAAPPSTLAALADRDADLVVVAGNTAALVEAVREHPFVRAFNSDGLNWAFAQARKRFRLSRLESIAREEVGFPLEKLYGAFPGPAALMVNREKGQYEFTFIAEVKGREAEAQALIGHQLEQPIWREDTHQRHAVREEDWRGTTLHLRVAEAEQPAPGWALTDGLLVLASSRERLERALTDVRAGSARHPWSESDAWRELSADHPEADLYLQFGKRALVELVSAQFRVGRFDGANLDEKQRAQVARMEEEARKLVTALELDAIRSLTGAARIEKGRTRLTLNLGYSEERGVLSLLTFAPGNARLPEFLPDNLTSVRASRLNIRGLWAALGRLSEGMRPLGHWTAEVRAGLTEMAQDKGIDLEKALLSALGDDVVIGSFPIPMKLDKSQEYSFDFPGDFWAFALSDPQTGELAATSVFGGEGSGFAAEDYQDTRLYVMRDNSSEEQLLHLRPAYAVTDGWLLYASDVAPLREALTRLRHPGAQEPAWGRKQREAIAQLPGGPASVSFHSPAPLMTGLFDKLLDRQATIPQPGGQCSPRPKIEAAHLEGYVDGAATALYKRPGRITAVLELMHHAL